MLALGFTVMATTVAGLAVVAMVPGRAWLGPRMFWGIGLVLVGLLGLWWRPRGEGEAIWAGLFLVVAGVVVLTDLSAHADPRFDDRILADDLPPVAVYVAGIGFGLAIVLCVVVTILRLHPDPVGPRGRTAAVVAGVLAGVMLMGTVVPVGSAARSANDRWAEADDMSHTVSADAQRRADGPGPAGELEQAWSAGTPPSATRSVAIPGWDVVLVVMDSDGSFQLTAMSATDGEELWTYRRQSAGGVDVRVDPESGRILLTGGRAGGRAAAVLDLENGSELVTRQLPGRCGAIDALLVSSTASLMCSDPGRDDRAVAVEVADGRVLATSDVLRKAGSYEEGWCEVSLARGAAPAVVQTGRGDCAMPELVAVGPEADGFTAPATVPLPPSWRDLPGPLPAFSSSVPVDAATVATGDHVVVQLDWLIDDDDPDAARVPDEERTVSELVLMTRDGELVWRSGPGDVLDVTDQGVVVAASEGWQLRSVEDGSVVAQDTYVEDEDRLRSTEPGLDRLATTDGERLYSLVPGGGDGRWDLVVRNLADLSSQQVLEDFAAYEAPPGPPAPPDTQLHITGGRLILRTEDQLVAYEEAEAG